MVDKNIGTEKQAICIHFWLLPRFDDKTVTGRCKFCGATRIFIDFERLSMLDRNKLGRLVYREIREARAK